LSDESSAENEAPKSKPPKEKLKLSVPKDNESRWQFVNDAKVAVLVNSLYLKIPLQAPNGPCRTLLLGEMGKTLEMKSMTHLYEQLATLVRTRAKHSNLKCGIRELSFWSD